MELEDFKKQTFSLSRHIPPTGLGFFDVRYSPSTSILNVDVKFEIFKFMGAAHIGKWQETDKVAFLQSFQSKIDEYWNDKFIISCIKEGWESIQVKPVFALTKVDSNFHYSIKVVGSAGTANTAVRTFQTDHDRSTNTTIQHATAVFGAQAADRFANAGSQNSNIVKALRLPLSVSIGSAQTGGQISHAMMSALKTYAECLSYVFSTAPTKPSLKVTSVGSKTTKDADRVVQVLRTFGVQNPMKTKAGVGHFGTSAPKGDRIVTIEWESPAQFDASVPKDPQAIPLASQATIAHEYGHMLGLPDEYNILCSQSTDFMAENKLVRSDAEKAVHLGNNPVSEAAQTDTIADNQKEFLRLCSEASIPPPPFGRPNINIMSGGSVFKDYHCITVWDALCRMTAAAGLQRKDWRINLI